MLCSRGSAPVALVGPVTRRRAVFLDLNGTMVLPVQPSSLDELALMPGIAEAVARLVDSSFVCPVVTVQSRIAKGVFSQEEFDRWFAGFAASLASLDAAILGPYVCPHLLSEECACEKPKTLLYERAAADHGIDLAGSWTVGDTAADVMAGAAFGGRACLVRTGWGSYPDNVGAAQELGAPIVDGLSNAVDLILL